MYVHLLRIIYSTHSHVHCPHRDSALRCVNIYISFINSFNSQPLTFVPSFKIWFQISTLVTIKLYFKVTGMRIPAGNT